MAGNMTRMRTQGPTPASYASRTLILDPTETPELGEDSTGSGSESTGSVGILRLRGDMSARSSRKIKWDDKVVDNEGMGKKKSKICCIYHKAHPVGESSDESDSSSSSDSDDSDRARPTHNHGHDDGDACNHQSHRGKGKRKNPRNVSPNAYERQPRYQSRPQPPINPHPHPVEPLSVPPPTN